MRINECMCHDVCFVHPDCNVYDAAKIMNENHVGCIPVCNDQNYVVGLITDRDIVLRMVACDKDAKTTPVSEIMTTDVCTCGCEDDVLRAQEEMSCNQIRRIPVVDKNNKMIGIITMGDLAHHGRNLNETNFDTTIEDICRCHGSIKNCC